jgi:hypothetical protein
MMRLRRAERRAHGLLKGTRYIWLRNPENLSPRQRVTLDALPTRTLKTVRAYQIRLAFQDLYEKDGPEQPALYLKRWYFWATHSRLEPVINAARTVKRHWEGILRWFDSKIANGLIEGINAWCRPPSPRPAATARSATSGQWSTCWPGSSTCGCPYDHVSTHAKQRGTFAMSSAVAGAKNTATPSGDSVPMQDFLNQPVNSIGRCTQEPFESDTVLER